MVPKSDRVDSLIICEGDTDRHFLNALIGERKLPKFQIMAANSKDNIYGTIALYKVESTEKFKKLKSLIIVVDKNGNADAAFVNASQQLQKTFPARKMPNASFVIEGTAPSLSIILIPTLGETGHIESYVTPIAKTHNGTLTGHIQTFLDTVRADKWTDERRQAKAWLRIFMAVKCPDPFMPLGELFGEAKLKHLIDLNHKSLDTLATFLGKVPTS